MKKVLTIVALVLVTLYVQAHKINEIKNLSAQDVFVIDFGPMSEQVFLDPRRTRRLTPDELASKTVTRLLLQFPLTHLIKAGTDHGFIEFYGPGEVLTAHARKFLGQVDIKSLVILPNGTVTADGKALGQTVL